MISRKIWVTGKLWKFHTVYKLASLIKEVFTWNQLFTLILQVQGTRLNTMYLFIIVQAWKISRVVLGTKKLARLARFLWNLKSNLARFWLVWLEPKLVSARLVKFKIFISSSRLVSPILNSISARLARASQIFVSFHL